MANFISITKYAELCGISKQGVWARINNKDFNLKAVKRNKPKKGYYIDLDNYPPVGEQKAGRKPL